MAMTWKCGNKEYVRTYDEIQAPATQWDELASIDQLIEHLQDQRAELAAKGIELFYSYDDDERLNIVAARPYTDADREKDAREDLERKERNLDDLRRQINSLTKNLVDTVEAIKVHREKNGIK